MANDIHVWLSDEDVDTLRTRARREIRSITNMATILIRIGLMSGTETISIPSPKRGRPKRGEKYDERAGSPDQS